MKKALIILLMAATAATPALAKGPKHGGGKGHEARAERHEQRQEHKQHRQEMRHHERAERKFERREHQGDFGFDRHAARKAERREHRFERQAPEFRAERHWAKAAKAERKQEKHFERRAEREHRRAERHFARPDKHAFKAERKFAKEEAKFERKLHKQEVKFERKLAKADGRDFAIERRLRMRQAAAPREYYEIRERRYAYAPEPVFAAAPSYAYLAPAAAYRLYAPAPAYGGDYYGQQDSYPAVSYGDGGLGSLLGGGGMSGILTALLPVFLQQAGLGDLGGLGGLGGGFGDAAGLGGYGGDPGGYDPAYQDYAGGDELGQGGLGDLAGLGGLGDMGSLLPIVGSLLGGGLGTGDSLLGGLGGLGDIGSLAGLGGGLGLGGADGMMTGYDDYAGYEADPQATLMQAVLPALMG
jgi:hypothetical protein